MGDVARPWFRSLVVLLVSGTLMGCAAQLPVLPSASFELPTPRPTDEPSPETTEEPPATEEPSEEPTPEPTAEATIEPTPEPTAVATAQATPEPTATATPAPGTWTGPERISLRRYSDVDMVVTADGTVHAAAALERSIWHVSNTSGEWIRVQISNPPGLGADAFPSIAMDDDGILSVAFQRLGRPDTFGRLPEGIFLTTSGPDSWTEPVQLDEDLLRDPSLAAKPNGTLNLAAGEDFPIDVVEEGQTFPIQFAYGLPDDVSAERIARIGTDPALAVGSDGLARILLGDNIGTLDERALRFMSATAASGDFTVENVPGTSNYDNAYDLVIDSEGVAHAVWHAEEVGGLFYSSRSGGAWSAPLLIQEDLVSAESGLGVDAAGNVHIVTASYTSGAWYFTNVSGTFTAQLLHDDTTIYADLAIDGSGRAHMLFVTADPDDYLPQELWYAASPGL